jgi:hypothetical protein
MQKAHQTETLEETQARNQMNSAATQEACQKEIVFPSQLLKNSAVVWRTGDTPTFVYDQDLTGSSELSHEAVKS